jgi:DNA-binding transcriptional MerR regulator
MSIAALREETTMKTDDDSRNHELLKIGDFARLAGTNLRTLRYYEEIGLFQPAARSQGGFRFYRATDVNRLKMVHTLQDLGLSLDRIREVMDTRRNGEAHISKISRVRGALKTQQDLLDARIAEIEVQKARLQDAVGKLTDCESCSIHPAPENNFCEPCPFDGKPLPEDLSALF